MWVVLLQCAALNILCNDSINHILHLYYCKFPYKNVGGSAIGIQTPDRILSVATAYWTQCYFKLILCYVLQRECTSMVA